ncbi:MAG: DUF507 family protein [Nitrospirae bacterium]|nr:DUF507 family protein [Nitrospirota bacterium]
MILSEDKINHLSHLIIKDLKKGLATMKGDEVAVLKEVKRLLTLEFHLEEEIDAIVRKKLVAYSLRNPEGTPEWQLQYNRFFEEEMNKRRR